jgi:hypothetical protein
VPVEITPETFTMVFYDAAEIVATAERLLAEIGRPDLAVWLEVDETTPAGRARVESVDPVVLTVEGGAFEDPKRPRHLSPEGTADVLGRLLLRVRDRLDPAFGEPPADDDLDLALSVAWDCYCVGRLARAGHRSQRQRRLYHFRNRHGFTDAADAAFERLWHAEDLTWAEIEAISAEATAHAA